jgi:hypothetical protein
VSLPHCGKTRAVCVSRSKRREFVSRVAKVSTFHYLVDYILITFLDNHMINGTKLLNVAGMTRGRRDGILKSEKTRHVVKIGPMHLKGVW